jgi:hypothetical protein
LVLSVKAAFNSEIKHLYYENPELYAKHLNDGEDNMLCTFIMYELGKGEKVFGIRCFKFGQRKLIFS